MDVNPTIILKVMSPMFVVKLGESAVEVDHLWEELLKLQNEKQYMDEDGNGYGAPDVDHEIGGILVAAGFAVRGSISKNYLPTPAFDKLYDDLLAFWELARLEPEKMKGGPQFVWPFEEVKPPDLDDPIGRLPGVR